MSCGVCAGRNRQGVMCSACHTALTLHLMQLAGWWLELAQTIQRRDRMPPGNGGDTPLPYNPRAAALRDRLAPHIGQYVRTAGARHIGQLAGFDWRQHDAGPELALTVPQWIAQIRDAVDIPDRGWLTTNCRCPNECSGHIRVYAGDRHEALARCDACACEWDATQFARLGKRIAAPGTRRVDVEAAATHAHVTPATIRQWAATGRLTITDGHISLDELDRARRHRTTRHLTQKWGTA